MSEIKPSNENPESFEGEMGNENEVALRSESWIMGYAAGLIEKARETKTPEEAEEIEHRALHYLWNNLPKDSEKFEGEDVPYMELPKNFFPGQNEGMVLHHKPTGEIMIFVTGDRKFRRYGVYHEYCEGRNLREEKSLKEYRAAIFGKINNLLELMGRTEGSVSELPPGLLDDLEKRIMKNAPHLEAYLDEIALAKKEMVFSDFDLFKKEARKRF